MKQAKLIVFAVLALFAFGSAAAAVANAETPALLIPSGSVTELTATGTGTTSKLEIEGGKTLTGTEVSASIKGCTALEGKETDTNSCEGTLIFKGVKKEATACRSENAKAEKDAIETVLTKLGLKLADEKSTEGVLQPLLISKVLGINGETELTVACGLVKTKVKGRIGCLLLPGLTKIAAGGKMEVLCKVKEGKQETGTCSETKTTCEELAADPFEGNLGEGFKKGGMSIHLEGSFNKEVFIDD
jgi:hypothetical protein